MEETDTHQGSLYKEATARLRMTGIVTDKRARISMHWRAICHKFGVCEFCQAYTAEVAPFRSCAPKLRSRDIPRILLCPLLEAAIAHNSPPPELRAKGTQKRLIFFILPTTQSIYQSISFSDKCHDLHKVVLSLPVLITIA